VTAETIAKALGGRKAGAGWMARCPAHKDRVLSLSIRDADGKVLVRRHAGCEQDRVMATLRSRGLWRESGPCRFVHSAPRSAEASQMDRDDTKRSESALAIWQAAMAGRRHAGRGLSRLSRLASPATADAPLPCRLEPSLRWHLAGDGGVATRGSHDTPLAIHRTFVARDGGGKALAEGIETCLAAMLATGRPAWAALFELGAAWPRPA
jgi:putative DNA primase/helicase